MNFEISFDFIIFETERLLLREFGEYNLHGLGSRKP